jgi:hypothetical protein
MKAPTRIVISAVISIVLVFTAVLLFHTLKSKRKDFTVLKRDLIELQQSLKGLSMDSGLREPGRFLRALERLERDYRLQRPEDLPTGSPRQLLDSCLQSCQLLRSTGSGYVAAISTSQEQTYWSLLQKNYSFIRNPKQDLIEITITALEAAEGRR